MFFLNSPGGIGKIFVQDTIMGKLRQGDDIVLAVVFSGIVAKLLDKSSIAHSQFKIPLDTINENTYNIKKEIDYAKFIKQAKLIFLDEAPMQCKHDFTAVSHTRSDLCNVSEDILFGGNVVCFCGNFRQTLPVVPGRL